MPVTPYDSHAMKPTRGNYMRRIIISAAALALTITGCGSPQQVARTSPAPTTAAATTAAAPDPVRCRAAIRGDYEKGWAANGDPWPPATRTPVCSGIDRPTLQRLMDEAIADIMNGTTGPG